MGYTVSVHFFLWAMGGWYFLFLLAVVSGNGVLLTLDDFELGGEPLLMVIPTNQYSEYPIFKAFVQPIPYVCGGERYMEMITESPSIGYILSGLVKGNYFWSNTYGGIATSLLRYDGIDSSSILNPVGLGGMDFTQNGRGFAFIFQSNATLPTEIEFKVYSDSYSVCTFVCNIAQGWTEYIIPFLFFDGNCNFEFVGAFEVHFTLTPFGGALFESFSVFGQT